MENRKVSIYALLPTLSLTFINMLPFKIKDQCDFPFYINLFLDNASKRLSFYIFFPFLNCFMTISFLIFFSLKLAMIK